MFVPGWCSLHRASLVLRHRHTTLVKWCHDLGIRLKPVGMRSRFICYRDLDRLTEYAENQPKPKPPVPVWDALAIDHVKEARTDRDRTLARRIKAASEWKKAHYGAYIGTAEMHSIEQCL